MCRATHETLPQKSSRRCSRVIIGQTAQAMPGKIKTTSSRYSSTGAQSPREDPSHLESSSSSTCQLSFPSLTILRLRGQAFPSPLRCRTGKPGQGTTPELRARQESLARFKSARADRGWNAWTSTVHGRLHAHCALRVCARTVYVCYTHEGADCRRTLYLFPVFSNFDVDIQLCPATITRDLSHECEPASSSNAASTVPSCFF